MSFLASTDIFIKPYEIVSTMHLSLVRKIKKKKKKYLTNIL